MTGLRTATALGDLVSRTVKPKDPTPNPVPKPKPLKPIEPKPLSGTKLKALSPEHPKAPAVTDGMWLISSFGMLAGFCSAAGQHNKLLLIESREQGPSWFKVYSPNPKPRKPNTQTPNPKAWKPSPKPGSIPALELHCRQQRMNSTLF